MRVLVTAGNTLTPIDRVRGITNIFTGRTGATIARHAHDRGHAVTLLTSHPEAVDGTPDPARWQLLRYQTFDHLARLMRDYLAAYRFDALIHCAAVSDYQVAGVFAPDIGTTFGADNAWQGDDGPPLLVDRSAGKVKSDEPELWLRLVRTPKLVDLVRTEWGFRGILVKFKLEVEVDELRLLSIAEDSRRQSRADWMVANTLEGMVEWAYLGSAKGYERVGRGDLASRLLDMVERQHRERADG